jgi:hypothetical protein
MIMRPFKRHTQSGYTAAEMIVATGVLCLLGGIFFTVLNSGMVLSAKNTAVNAAHEEARFGILRLTRDIHASISVPQLRDSSYNVASSTPVGGVAPLAAGVSFQNIFSGPNYVWKDPNNPSLIMVKDNPDKPVAGMRLIVPFWGLETDITKIVGNGGHHNVFINADQSTPNIGAPAIGNPYAILYYTKRVMYIVEGGNYVADSQGGWIVSGSSYAPYTSGAMQRYRFENGELRLYTQLYNGSSTYWSYVSTAAKYISSPTPFYIPLASGGGTDNKYVGVNLTARDPKSSNRGYLASSSLLSTQIDYRSRLTSYQ